MTDPAMHPPEPSGFAAQVPKLRLEIRSTRPMDDTWLEVRLSLFNGTSEVVTAERLAEWSRNVGWYCWKDDMADDAVRFEGGTGDLEIPPGESAELTLSVLRACAREGSPRQARRLRIDFEYLDEAHRGVAVSSNTVEPNPSAGGPAATPTGPGRGCLGALFVLFR